PSLNVATYVSLTFFLPQLQPIGFLLCVPGYRRAHRGHTVPVGSPTRRLAERSPNGREALARLDGGEVLHRLDLHRERGAHGPSALAALDALDHRLRHTLHVERLRHALPGPQDARRDERVLALVRRRRERGAGD